jgi:hypothetical protein
MFRPRRFLLTRALVPNISALSANWALNGTPTKSDVIQAKFADFAGFARSHTSKIQAGPLIKSQSPNPLNTRFFNSLVGSNCVRVCHAVSG